MTTSYKFRFGFTKGGTATLPANAPTIDIMDCDTGALLITAGSLTAGTGIPGSYMYTLGTGTGGLDLMGIAKTVDATMDQMHLYSYPLIAQIWDEVQSATAHDVANSAGRLLREFAAAGTSGTKTLAYTLTDSVTALPIAGATIDLFTMAAMTGTPVDSQVTDVFGIVNFVNLVAGTYYLRITKAGYATGTDTEVVS